MFHLFLVKWIFQIYFIYVLSLGKITKYDPKLGCKDKGIPQLESNGKLTQNASEITSSPLRANKKKMHFSTKSSHIVDLKNNL